MKFQLLFFLVLALVATFIATETEAAPSKQHGKHLLKASNIELWTRQLGQFLQNGKRQEQKTPKFIKATELTRSRVIENPALLKFVEYLTWLDDLVVEDWQYEIFSLLEDPTMAFIDFVTSLYYALGNAEVGVDVFELLNELNLELQDEFYGFLEDATVFWKSWVDDREHIPENLLIHIPQIQVYLKAYGTKTFNCFMNLVYLSQTLLTPEALEELLDVIQITLDKTGVAIDKLKVVLKPPTDIVPPPTNVTLESFLGFLPYLAQLNMSSIILDGLSTAGQLKDLRLTFDEDLVALLGEGSVDGADLESQGRNITASFDAAVDAAKRLNRQVLDNVVYTWFYGVGWDFINALGDFFNVFYDTFEEIPPVALETVLQLEGLADTLSPEYQQRASNLVTEAIQKSDSLIQNYLQVFKPKEN